MVSEVVEAALCERIRRLERRVAELECALAKAEAATLDATLGPLRLREAVLLYLGTESESVFAERLAKDFGSAVANQALRHLFVLDNAPLSELQREALRTAFNGGMGKW